MTKNQNSEMNIQEPIDKIKQELAEEYKNLSWFQAGYVAIGVETGNEKYDNLNKQYLNLNKNNLSVLQTVTQAVGNGISALQFVGEVAQVIPLFVKEFNNLKAIGNATTDSDAIDATCKVIANAEPFAKKISTVLHSPTISDTSKETIIQSTIIPYALTPILNKGLANITENFQSSETEEINVLDKVSPRFIRELTTLGVDLVAKALEDDLNPKVQEIYKNIKQKNDSSQAVILQNIHDIIISDKVNPLLTKNLVEFLKSPDNQKDLAQFTENIINNKVQKFASPELVANTLELVANSSEKLIEIAPLAIKTFNQFKENQHWSNTNLMMEGVDIETKKMLLAAKKPQIVELLNNAKKIVDTLSPVLEKELPQYLAANKQNILDVLKHPMVAEKIKSFEQDPEFISNAVNVSMPFLQDALPSITKLISHTFSESDKIADILQKSQLITSLPDEEKSKELKALLGTLVQIKNDNPEINKIIEKDLPELLIKHANSLGPVVDEFLNNTPIGQKLKLDGEKLVKIVGDHVPELIKITDKFTKHEYVKMIIPALKLLSDPKVLGVIAESIINLGKSKFSKAPEQEAKQTVETVETVGPNVNKILRERANQRSGVNIQRN